MEVILNYQLNLPNRVIQPAGSYVITGPGVLHEGFNSGENIAEAINFAIPEWLSQPFTLYL